MSRSHGFRRIAVLYGGRGGEHDISVLSAASVLAAFHPAGDDVLPVRIEKNGQCVRADTHVPVCLVRRGDRGGFLEEGGRFLPVDAALPVLHGDHGEDGEVQGWLKAVGIPFVGADIGAGAVCSNKIYAKRLARDAGVPTLPFAVLSGAMTEKEMAERVGHTLAEPAFPVFVKPASGGSSLGASVVLSPDGLSDAVRRAAVYGDVLAEPYLSPVRELEIGWLEGHDPAFSEIGEIESAKGFYDYDEKYKSATAGVKLPANIPKDVGDRLRRYAKTLTEVLGVRDLCRLDFFYTGDGRLFFNEVNTFPGCTSLSLFPAMWERLGVSPSEMWEALVSAAYDRGV